MGEEVKAGPVVPESVLKKRKREEQWALAKKQGLESAKKKNSENRKLIYNRAKQYAKEYDEQQKECFMLTQRPSCCSLSGFVESMPLTQKLRRFCNFCV